MEFLVRMTNTLPPDTPRGRRAELLDGERARAMELRGEGLLQRLWRVPGRADAVGLWEAADATVLHDALASLPMYPWLDITVEALATHPQERTGERAQRVRDAPRHQPHEWPRERSGED